MSDLVVVTGGSGYLGLYVVKAALDAGYRVRTTVRSLSQADAVRAAVGAPTYAPLEFARAELLSDDGWHEALAEARYVLHVASPYPAAEPRTEAELIVPAREGTMRVLRAALDAGVQRVVVTSSFAAVGYGHGARTAPYTEADWTDTGAPGVAAYQKSKTLAERAAWQFAASHPALELVAINPVGIFGPPLRDSDNTSVALARTALRSPFVPDLQVGVVDVRDVAQLELAAMTHPHAAGKRFLAVAEFVHLRRFAATVGRRPAVLPSWIVRAAAPFSATARSLAGELGVMRSGSADRARIELGWQPRPIEETIRDMAATFT